MSASRSSTPPPRARRLALGVLVGLAVVGALLWGLLASSGSDGEPESSAPTEQVAAAPESGAALPFADAPAELNSEAQEPAARVALATPPQLVMERPRIFRGGDTIHGRYLLEHADVPEGVLATRASFVLDVAFEGAVRSLDVEVVRGHWTCELPVPFREVLRLEVRDVQVDGRPCELQASISPAVGAETIPNDIVVRGHCAWDALLEVVDALTKRPLDEALVVPIEFASNELPVFHAQLPAPPPRRTPLDLAPLATKMPEQFFFVSSPGYGWKCISVDLSRESTQRVELVPGGELTLLGAPTGGDLRVSAVLPDGSQRAVVTGSCSTLPWKLTGLAPGEYEVLTFPAPPRSEMWISCGYGAPPERIDVRKLLDSNGSPIQFEEPNATPGQLPEFRLRARVTAGVGSEVVLGN